MQGVPVIVLAAVLHREAGIDGGGERRYVETGSYLEKIFPALGTRFISVKENFDNFTCGNAMESLSVSLQNLVNAMYSRDISKKVLCFSALSCHFFSPSQPTAGSGQSL